MIKILVYLIVIIFFYRVLNKLVSLPKKNNSKYSENKRGIKYQDAEYKEID